MTDDNKSIDNFVIVNSNLFLQLSPGENKAQIRSWKKGNGGSKQVFCAERQGTD